MFYFDWNTIDWHLILLIVGIGLLVIAVAIVVFVTYYKTSKKLLIRLNSRIEYIEQALNDLFQKRIEMLSVFDKKAKNLVAPNLYSDISEKVRFKKETDKYIKSDECRATIMDNNAEIAQIANQYNAYVERYNKMIKRPLVSKIAKRYGFQMKNIFDEGLYNKE